jgi:hypothetical protein
MLISVSKTVFGFYISLIIGRILLHTKHEAVEILVAFSSATHLLSFEDKMCINLRPTVARTSGWVGR